MEEVWGKLKDQKLNTILLPVYWELIEKEEEIKENEAELKEILKELVDVCKDKKKSLEGDGNKEESGEPSEDEEKK